MKLKAMPCPSPNGTNFENLYLVRAPRGSGAQGALDSALKRGARDRRGARDEEGVDLAALREALEGLLRQCLAESEFAQAVELLDEHLPAPAQDRHARDRHHARDEEHEPAAERTRAQMARYLKGLGCTEETVKAVLGEIGEDEHEHDLEDLPRNGREGGMGGRAHGDYDGMMDRKHGARDRRRGQAHDAASDPIAAAMARIGIA